jgi:hypothetical protein
LKIVSREKKFHLASGNPWKRTEVRHVKLKTQRLGLRFRTAIEFPGDAHLADDRKKTTKKKKEEKMSFINVPVPVPGAVPFTTYGTAPYVVPQIQTAEHHEEGGIGGAVLVGGLLILIVVIVLALIGGQQHQAPHLMEPHVVQVPPPQAAVATALGPLSRPAFPPAPYAIVPENDCVSGSQYFPSCLSLEPVKYWASSDPTCTSGSNLWPLCLITQSHPLPAMRF